MNEKQSLRNAEDHPTAEARAVSEAAKRAFSCADVMRLNAYGSLGFGIIMVRLQDGTIGTAKWTVEAAEVRFADRKIGLDSDRAEIDYEQRGFRLLAQVRAE